MAEQAAMLLGYLIGIAMIAGAVGGYLWGAYVSWRIGRKLGIGSFGEYCIPIYNSVLACRWIGLSGWAALWFFMPWLVGFGLAAFVSLSPQAAPALIVYWIIVALLAAAFLVYFWGSVAERLGKSFWLYGITTVIFAGIPVLFLAFDESIAVAPAARAASASDRADISLRCTSGELANAVLLVPPDGLYIGRNPSKVQLVLHSPQVSNVHARIWPTADGAALWIEDWNSLNGTYYCSVNGPITARTKWHVLRGRVQLQAGSRFRVGDRVVEFEVRGA